MRWPPCRLQPQRQIRAPADYSIPQLDASPGPPSSASRHPSGHLPASRPASSASRSLVCLPGAYRSHHAACCWRIAMCISLATHSPRGPVLLRSMSSNVRTWLLRVTSACRTWSCVPVSAGIGSVVGADKPDLSRQCGDAGAAPPTVHRHVGLSPEPFTVALATCSTIWRISLECGPDQNRHSPATYRQAASRCCFIASTKWPTNASTLGPTGSLSARMNAQHRRTHRRPISPLIRVQHLQANETIEKRRINFDLHQHRATSPSGTGGTHPVRGSWAG